MLRSLIVSALPLIVTLIAHILHCSSAYDVYGRVNEPLHIEDSQVTIID